MVAVAYAGFCLLGYLDSSVLHIQQMARNARLHILPQRCHVASLHRRLPDIHVGSAYLMVPAGSASIVDYATRSETAGVILVIVRTALG